MGKGRLEAFSDGVIAVALTIMVLDLHPPHSAEEVRHLLPALLVYILSFLYVGIYWNNHHHLLHLAERVSGMTLWANLHLLFWITLIPFVTGWAGESHFEPFAVAAYGAVLFMAGVAWQILRAVLVACHGPDSKIATALRNSAKEWTSVAMYLAGIIVALAGQGLGWGAWCGYAAFGFYAVVAVVWFYPDRRIEAAARAQD